MNLLLHGIAGKTENELPISCSDSLKALPRRKADVVLTNPPFGVKGSITYANEHRTNRPADDLTIVRQDFWVQTANKQLNFVQHVFGVLKPGGRAAIVLPDNVLFEGGTAKIIRKRLLEQCDVHTLLRLPAGLFYAAGVRANVLFFDKLEPKAADIRSRRALWVYDLRTEKRFSVKTSPLRSQDLEEFLELYQPNDRFRRKAARAPRAASRWSATPISEILQSAELSFDIGSSAESVSRKTGLSALEDLTLSIEEDLRRALGHVSQILPTRN
jgi:type I restriction enzyme M protein